MANDAVAVVKIRKNEDNSITPVIVLSSNEEKEHRLEILKNQVQFQLQPFQEIHSL